jgi:ABC-type glycerol-3-phosphate transport system substrate-binding protein
MRPGQGLLNQHEEKIMNMRPSTHRRLGTILAAALLLSACGPAASPEAATEAAPTEAAAATQAPEATAAVQPTQAPAAEVTEVWIVTGAPEGSNEQILFSQISQQFEAENPQLKVKWEFAGYDLYDQKIRGYQEAGNPPDAFGGSLGHLIQYALDGHTVPLDEYLAQQNYEGDAVWKDSFYPSLMEQNYLENAGNGPGYYAIPFQMHIGGMFYNMQIFEDLGLQPANSIQEMLEQCATIQEAGITCFGVDGGFTPYITIPWAYIASRVGSTEAYYDTALHKEGTSWTDNPDWLTAAELTQQVYNYTQSGFLGSAWPAAQVEFAQGKMAMMWIPTWLPAELIGVAPEDFRMRLFRWPEYEGGKGDQTVTQLNFNGYAVLEGAKHPQEAMDFLKFQSSRLGTEMQAEQLLIPSPTIGAQMPESLAGVQDILSSSATAPEGMGVDNDAAEWRTSVLEPLLSDLALGMDPAEFLSELQAQSDEYYANQ